MNTALARPAITLLLLAFSAGLLLHVDRTPWWCGGVALLAVFWRWQALRGRLPLPGRWLRMAITLLLLAGVLASFRTLTGLAAGSALLLVMGAAKLLETRAARDARVVAVVSLVLVLAATLDRQSLLRVPFYAITAWASLAAVAALGSVGAAESMRRALAMSGRTLLLALPLGILCFVFVPRLPGALWSAPGGAARTGLSDEMSPGSISELSISDDIAFRVRFDDAVPTAAERYWRGPVLHEFDGYTWRRGRQPAVAQPVEALSPALHYEVILEPHGRNYLFALDTPEQIVGQRSLRTFDGQFLSFREVTSTIAYGGVSRTSVRHGGPLSMYGRRIDTQLPPDRNSRSLALARQLRAQSRDDETYTQRVLSYFRDAGFEYSLTPPLLQQDSVDDLIFRSRLGFCGHFASAYVTLMRAAGIPSRVVTGYLGGTWNPIGGYFAVRQSDAHAWAEVWLEGQGWVRIDPTAVVAPERLQRGLRDLLPESRSAADAVLGSAAWLRDLRDGWDAAGNWWKERVVNFNRASQRALLERLGLDGLDWGGMALVLAAGAGTWGLALFVLLTRRERAEAPDALGRLWARFLALLARRGLAIEPHEGPEAIRLRARERWPEAAADLDAFAECYERLRFGPAPNRPPLRALTQQLRRIARATAAHRPPRTAAAARG